MCPPAVCQGDVLLPEVHRILLSAMSPDSWFGIRASIVVIRALLLGGLVNVVRFGVGFRVWFVVFRLTHDNSSRRLGWVAAAPGTEGRGTDKDILISVLVRQ